MNGYIPDPENGSGAYARNGFALGNAGNVATPGFGTLFGKAIYAHTQLDGSILNFVIGGDGNLYRVTSLSEGAMTVTDVSPAGIAIAGGSGGIAYITSMVAVIGGVTQSVIVVNDGVNKPWYGTNLTGTPITGTVINYDGLGSAWTAYGPPVVWQGAVFFVLRTVNGVNRAEDIAWSEPGDPSTGYQQATFDNNMTLVQHSTGALFGLAATNMALYYFRGNSIGVVYGSLGNLASTNTQDAVSVNVGCTTPATIQQFGNAIYFCDVLLRPYRFTFGSEPEPIWRQMRTWTRQHSNTNEANETLPYVTSVIEPSLNLYLVLLWRDDQVAPAHVPSTVLYVFKAETGAYLGRWTVSDAGAGGVGINVMGILYASDPNAPTLVFLGEKTRGTGALGYLWFLRTQGWDSGTGLGDANQWLDSTDAGGVLHPNVQVVPDRIGESSDTIWNVDRVTLVTANASPCQVSIGTPNAQGVVEGTPTPAASQDGTYRLVVGCDGVAGRGPSVTIAPTASDPTLDQWALHQVALAAVPSQAGPEEP